MSFLKRWRVPHQVGDPEINQNFEDLERYTDGLIGEWIPLELAAALEVNAGAYVPAARLEQNGTVVRFRGLVKIKAAKELIGGGVMFTLPKSLRPSKIVGVVAISVNLHAAAYIQAEVNGEVKFSGPANLKEGDQLWLDGLTFSVDK